MAESTDHLEIINEIAARLFEKIQEQFTVMPTLTLNQAAEAMGVSPEKVRQLCKAGELPHIKMDKLYRIKPGDVNAWLHQHYHGKKVGA